MGRVDEAKIQVQKVIELEPDRVIANWMFGLIETWGLGNYGVGIAHFEKAAELDPQGIYAPGFLVFAALDLLDLATAEYWADIAWQRIPDKYMSCQARLLVAEFKGDAFRKEFLPCLKGMMRDESHSAYPFRVLRDIDLEHGEAGQALQRYRESSAKLFQREGPTVTKDNLQKAIDLYPVLELSEMSDLADELLRQATEVVQYRPRLTTGGYGWADVEIHALRGEKAKALTVLRQAIDEGLRAQWYTLARNQNLQSLWEEPEFKSLMAQLEADMIARRELIKADTAAKQ